MKLSIVAGSTSQTVDIFAQDSSKTDGSGLAGLVYNSSLLTCYYNFPRAASTLVTLGTLSSATAEWSSGGFKEIDATNQKGKYRFDIPNALLAAGNGRYVGVTFQGATSLAPVLLEIELTGWDNQDSVRGALTALPNAAAAATGGLPTVDSTNSVKVQTSLKKNTAITGFMFQMTDSSGNTLTGLTVTSQVSIDGASFNSTSNSVSEVSNGWYKITLIAAETNGVVIALRFSATGASDTDLVFLTLP